MVRVRSLAIPFNFSSSFHVKHFFLCVWLYSRSCTCIRFSWPSFALPASDVCAFVWCRMFVMDVPCHATVCSDKSLYYMNALLLCMGFEPLDFLFVRVLVLLCQGVVCFKTCLILFVLRLWFFLNFFFCLFFYVVCNVSLACLCLVHIYACLAACSRVLHDTAFVWRKEMAAALLQVGIIFH